MRGPLFVACLSLVVAACGGGGGAGTASPASGSGQTQQQTSAASGTNLQATQTTSTAVSGASTSAPMNVQSSTNGTQVVNTAAPAAVVPGSATQTIVASAPAPQQPLNRSGVDQPDDLHGAQVHLVYAIPADGVDHAFDLSETIANTTGSYNNWLAQQTAGNRLKIDTYQGRLDVTFVRLPRSDAAYDAFGYNKRDVIEADMRAMRQVNPDKIYAVYYDGGNVNTCADAPHPPALAGQVAVLYMRGAVPGYMPCQDNPYAAGPTAAPGYLDFTMLHEILHTMGAVDDRAPNAVLNGHVNTDPTDLMYAGPLPWNPSVLDSTKANYYNPNGLAGGLFNLANSLYLMR
ncbi:MAG: hypothetical protein JWQ00_2053 [Noviherbaspirillum sp.]|nr:hypothetical protein [Noviherbaspirillum sp.]